MRPPIATSYPAARRQHGVTLIELVVSLAVITVLLAGMTSAIVLATQALPTGREPAGATVDSGRALHQLRDELNTATELLNRTATSVTLNLPDRDGDRRPEAVTYAWSGTPGDPLTRAENGSSPAPLLENIQAFSFNYITTDVSSVFPGGITTSDEVELSSHAPDGIVDSFRIGRDDRLGFRFTPTLPSGAVSWQVNRVLIRSDGSGTGGGQATFELSGSNSSGPTTPIIESVEVPEAQLDVNNDWAEITFTTGGPFNPGQTAAVTIEDTGRGNPAEVVWNPQGTPPNALESDGDNSWIVHNSTGAVDHFVFGTYTGVTDGWTLTRSRVTAVGLTLVQADAPAITHRLTVSLPNAPEAVDELWEADFNADPTLLDLAADGQADWFADGSFDPRTLVDGRWSVNNNLRSVPDNLPLDTPFTLSFWGEDTLTNGNANGNGNTNGGGVQLRFDRSGSMHAFVAVEIDLTGSGQVVQVVSTDASGGRVIWHTQTQPAGVPVRCELAVDPANDTVGVTIDGEVAGSFVYQRLSDTASPQALSTFADASNSGFQLDRLRMALGGTVTITPEARPLVVTNADNDAPANNEEADSNSDNDSLFGSDFFDRLFR